MACNILMDMFLTVKEIYCNITTICCCKTTHEISENSNKFPYGHLKIYFEHTPLCQIVKIYRATFFVLLHWFYSALTLLDSVELRPNKTRGTECEIRPLIQKWVTFAIHCVCLWCFSDTQQL